MGNGDDGDRVEIDGGSPRFQEHKVHRSAKSTAEMRQTEVRDHGSVMMIAIWWEFSLIFGGFSTVQLVCIRISKILFLIY